jgi:Flp pilus assembly protein TadB
MSLLQLILIFLIVLISAGVGFWWLTSRQSAQKKILLNKIKGHAHVEKTGAPSQKGLQDKRRAEIAKKLKDSKLAEKDGKKKTTLTMLIDQAGMKMSVKQYWIFSVVSMMVFVLLAKVMGYPSHILLLAAIIGFFWLSAFRAQKKSGEAAEKISRRISRCAGGHGSSFEGGYAGGRSGFDDQPRIFRACR